MLYIYISGSCKELLAELLASLKNSPLPSSPSTLRVLETASLIKTNKPSKSSKKTPKKQYVKVAEQTSESLSNTQNVALSNEQRNQLLKADPSLRDLYHELVVSGIISEEEFWKVREASIEIEATNKTLARNSAAFPFSQQQQQQKQQQGLSSSLVNNIQSLLSSEGSTNIFASSIVQPVKETDDVLHFKLTAATIHQIFVDHPAVRVAYKRLVPEKMSEQEFWTKYLQSQYYKLRQQSSATNSPSHNEKETRNDETDTARTGTRRNKRTSAQLSEETKDLGKDELFTNENYDESAELKAKIREMDPTFSLIKEETEDDENSYGLKRDRRGKRKREVDATTAALIQKMNRHAALILDSFQDNQTMTDVETSKMSEVLGGTQPSSNVTNTLPSPCSPHRYSSVTSNTINNNNNTDELEETTKYRQLIQDKVTLRDLEDDESARTSSSSSASNLQSLLSPQCLFVSTDASAKIATKRDCRDYMSALTALKDEIKHWEPSRTKVYVPMEVAGKITETLFPSVLSGMYLF
jgi:hypothetical protein